jgi:hypothetical protein
LTYVSSIISTWTGISIMSLNPRNFISVNNRTCCDCCHFLNRRRKVFSKSQFFSCRAKREGKIFPLIFKNRKIINSIYNGYC